MVVSGGFDPIHSGHIEYFKSAKQLGDHLIVALNSDKWLINKKGKFFMPFHERQTIISNLGIVDEVIDFDDDQEGSCC
ncbi:MAG: adenylyltransferase/cytidyltransferase family protein, partial [Gammaproteobacteria bacterium]